MAMPGRPVVPLASIVAEMPGVPLVLLSQAEDGIGDDLVTGVQTCVLPISVLISSSVLLLVAFSVPVLASVSLLRSRSPPLASSRPTLLKIGRASCRERV